MSTNSKNIIREEFLKNFTTKIKRRHVVIESSKNFNDNFQKTINSINSNVNQIIQLLNLKIEDRQIPYITLTAQFSSKLNQRSRIVIRSKNTPNDFEKDVKNQTVELGESLSHCIDFLISPGYKEIVISALDLDAEIVVANEYIECAIIDILLDIAMFNSYSFLKSKPLEWKHNFSFKKYEFFKTNKCTCFYECKTNKELYYSLAFSARKNKDSFDVDKYIELWNLFILNYFSDFKHREKSILEQLKQHVDYEELPSNLYKRFNKKPAGAYLILRTNRERSEDLQSFICSTFGIDKYEKGKIKIIPITDFDTYKPLLENLDVSAFKIVKSPTKSESDTEKENLKKSNKSKLDTSNGLNKELRFKIALSFPGEQRDLVKKIAQELNSIYGSEAILYDENLLDELAVADLDLLLDEFYKEESELIVVFICKEYEEKNWCGVEWRAIREIINEKTHNERVMFIKCGDGQVKGFSEKTCGYIEASKYTVNELVEQITKRYNKLKSKNSESKE